MRQPCSVLHSKVDGAVNFFPYPWHAIHNARRNFANVVQHGFDTFGVASNQRLGDLKVRAEAAFIYVGNRQVTNDCCAWRVGQDVHTVVHGCQNVAGTDHDAFWFSCCPAGVNQHADLVAFRGSCDFTQVVGALFDKLLTFGNKSVPADYLWVFKIFQTIHVEDNDQIERWYPILNLKIFVQLFIVFDKQYLD